MCVCRRAESVSGERAETEGRNGEYQAGASWAGGVRGFGVERKTARDDAHSNVAGRAWLGELP